MIILLNGPLGIGKSTLAEALSESIPQCVMLDGDHLVAANPAAADPLEHLHSTIELLIAHHRRFGYAHFVIPHLWTSRAQVEDLRRRLAGMEGHFRCFLLSLPLEENLRRIQLRQSARAIDEREFEARTLQEEREALASNTDGALGEPFDVSAPVAQLVERMQRQLSLD